jgi:hypothetical protein
VKVRRSAVPFVLLFGLALIGWSRVAAAQGPTDLTGSWTLNRASSQFPDEIGFGADPFEGIPGARSGSSDGRRGRRGGEGGGGTRPAEGLRPFILPETQQDAQRRRFLTDEVRLPPARLTIAVTPANVTITPDLGAARTLTPGRRDETVTLGSSTTTTTATWEEGNRLTVAYTAEASRVVRYTYAVTPNPRQLIVDVEFVGRGGGDKVRRVYDPAPPGQPVGTESNTTPEPSPVAGSAPPPRLLLPPDALPPGTRPLAGIPSAAAPPASVPPAAAIDQRPDAPLKGLARLGLVVEGLEADAAKCGLKADALEGAVSKHLTDAGFRVLRNTDDETYLYVNVNAVTASAGLCVTRYDVTLYSHAAAPLSHTSAPVELQVELLHKGGLAGGSPAQNGEAVTKNVLDYVDQFATRVKNANK